MEAGAAVLKEIPGPKEETEHREDQTGIVKKCEAMAGKAVATANGILKKKEGAESATKEGREEL